MKELIYSQEDLDLILSLEIEEKDKELDQYKNNWEELKKYIGKEWYCFDNESLEFEITKSILNKMKELEENN